MALSSQWLCSDGSGGSIVAYLHREFAVVHVCVCVLMCALHNSPSCSGLLSCFACVHSLGVAMAQPCPYGNTCAAHIAKACAAQIADAFVWFGPILALSGSCGHKHEPHHQHHEVLSHELINIARVWCQGLDKLLENGLGKG